MFMNVETNDYLQAAGQENETRCAGGVDFLSPERVGRPRTPVSPSGSKLKRVVLHLASIAAALLVAHPALAQPDFLLKWGSAGSGPGQFNDPSGIAVDALGDVYVADQNNHRIQKFDGDGAYLTEWGGLGTGNGDFNTPRDVAVDASGYVYVTDSGNNRVQKFTDTGTYVDQWGGLGSGDGQFRTPKGIAVDASGYVYVTEDPGFGTQKRVQKFTDTGTYVTKWGLQGSGDGQFYAPRGIDVDNAGYVYVTDATQDRVQKFTDTGVYVDQWGSNGSGQAQFVAPIGIACSGGDLYVVDSQNHRIQECSTSGVFAFDFGSACQMPAGSGCTDPDGGGPLATGDGQVYFPLGVAVNADGDVYVVDTENQRIQKFGEALQVGIPDEALLPRRLAVYPNPTSSGTSIQLALGAPGDPGTRSYRVDARVYDLAGKPIKHLFSGDLPGGTRNLRWSGDTDGGVPAAPGIFWIRVQVDGETVRSAKVVRIP